MNEENQEVIDIVVANATKDDNEIYGLVIQAGVPFEKAKNVVNKILVSQGLRMTKEQRDEKAEELLASFDVSTETTSAEVVENIEILMDELSISKMAARNYVKGLFINEDIEMPKAAKGAGGVRSSAPGFKGDVQTAANFALEHPEASESDKEDFKAYMDEHGGSLTKNGADKSVRWYASVADLRIFGKQWQDKHCD